MDAKPQPYFPSPNGPVPPPRRVSSMPPAPTVCERPAAVVTAPIAPAAPPSAEPAAEAPAARKWTLSRRARIAVAIAGSALLASALATGAFTVVRHRASRATAASSAAPPPASSAAQPAPPRDRAKHPAPKAEPRVAPTHTVERTPKAGSEGVDALIVDVETDARANGRVDAARVAKAIIALQAEAPEVGAERVVERTRELAKAIEQLARELDKASSLARRAEKADEQPAL